MKAYCLEGKAKTQAVRMAWNQGATLNDAVKRAAQKIAAWDNLSAEEKQLFAEYSPSGKRSYLCALRNPLITDLGIFFALKLKAIGNTHLPDPHPPTQEAFDHLTHLINVSEDGSVIIEVRRSQPCCGLTHPVAERENNIMQRANQARLPSPLALGVGQYPELCFEGQTLGFNVMAVESMETDLSRLGNIFQITPASPEEYLSMVTQSFFDSREVANLLQLFRAAGRTQREYNDNGLIPNDCHAGNYSLTKAGSTILNDFGQGKTKDELTPQQISMLQLLDLRRFLNSIFEMRFYSAGELFLADNNPAQAFLQGYFGKEVYTAHEKEIGNPDQMLRKLDTDKGFISRLKILKFAFEHLYGPLQSVLENEDNQFPLNEQERKEKRIEICRQLINQRKLNQS